MASHLELVTFTKGIEYLLAIAFVIGFLAFWQLVYGAGKGLAFRVAVLAYLALGPAVLAASCLGTVPR